MVGGGTLLDGCVPWPRELAERYRTQGVWSGETLGALLTRLARTNGSRTALIDTFTSLTYAELEANANRLARGLRRKGLDKDDVVVVQLPNLVTWYEVCFALWKLGAVPVLANAAHRAHEITSFCAQTRAKAYFVADVFDRFDYRELAATVKGKTDVEQVFVAGNPGAYTALDTVLELGTENDDLPTVSASQVALLQLSGGSTGVPKLIPRTHDDYLYSVRQSVEVCNWDSSVVAGVVLPCSHNFPLSSPGALGSLLVGGATLLLPNLTPSRALPLLEANRVNTVALVPALVGMWLDALPPSTLARMNIQVGGAKLDIALANKLHQASAGKMQQVFGMAEGLVNYTRTDDSLEHVLNTQGRPMSPLDEVRVVDEEDEPVPPGGIGHLLTRGPYTIRGYYRSPEHNATAFTREGFYRTGDMVRQLPSGHLIVEGRAKDQINRGGEKVAAQEVEALLRRTGLVVDAALVPVPDVYLGEKTCAFVCGSDSSISLERVRRALHDLGVAAYKLPDRLIWLPDLPRTPIGKVNKVALRKLT